MKSKWEVLFAVIVVVCATAALCFSSLTEDNFIYILSLVFTFLGGIGYGYVKARRAN